jgi:hypothetical protein
MSSIPNPAPNKAAMLGLALLLPALISLAHSLASSPSQPAISGQPRPALAFDQYLFNMGEPPVPRAIHEAQFHFDNRSDRPVKITDIKPSCGCLTPKIVGFNAERRHVEQREFAPGEHGVLAMGIRPAKETPGEKSYTVAVTYDDGQPRTEVLEFRITLPKKKLTVEPNELYFYQVSGEPDSRVVVVSDFRDTPAQIKSVSMITGGAKEQAKPLEGAAASLGTATRGADGETTWPIQVDVAPNLPSGQHTGWLAIETTDPENPTVKIPIVMFGREQATVGTPVAKPKFFGPVRQAAADSESVE